MSNKERAILNIGAKIPKGWKILVQETKALPSWVYCLKDAQDGLFYCKVGTCFDGTKLLVLFEPLSSDEIEKLGIEESFSHIEETEKHWIEESESTKAWNPEEESFEAYKKRLGLETQSGELNIKSVENMREKLKELEEEKEDYRSKLQLVADKAFEEKKRALDAPEDIDTPEKLEGFELAKTEKSIPSGSVPLYGQNQELEPKGYLSKEDMVRDLFRKSTSGKGLLKKEAEQVLNEFWRKSLQGLKDGQKPIKLQIPTDSQIKQGLGIKDLLNVEFHEKKRRLLKGEED